MSDPSIPVNNENSQKNFEHLDSFSNSNLSELFSLFYYDWFLVEIGKQLINPFNEHDLINILLLNKEINKRATIVFRKHFLNFELQKEMKELIKNREFKQIQSIFERQGLSLNPNQFTFTYENESEIPKCVHDPKLMKEFELSACSCSSQKRKIHLSTIASRLGFNSLVTSILHHPRLDFINLQKFDCFEAIQWTIVNDDLNSFQNIVAQFSNNLMEIFSWSSLISSCVIYSRMRILNCLLIVFHDFYIEPSGIIYFEKHFKIELFVKMNAIKMFDMVLNCRNIWMSLSEIVPLGFEYVQICALNILENFPNLKFTIRNSNDEKIMNSLLEGALFKRDKESYVLALRFAFRFGLEKGFKEVIETQQLSDDDLLDLFQNHSKKKWDQSVKPQIMKLILNNLNENTKLDPDELPLEKCLNAATFDDFQLIWNDKHFKFSRDWIHEFLFDQFAWKRMNRIIFLIPKCDLSLQTKYRWGGLDITTEFRNCCWLRILGGSYVQISELAYVQNQFGIKWSEDLLDWSLQVLRLDEEMCWLLENSEIDSSWWTVKRRNSVFILCCTTSKKKSFEKVLTLWPNSIDFSANGNMPFRTLLTSCTFSDFSKFGLEPMFSKLESEIRFSDENERKEMIELAKEGGHYEYIQKIQQIKLINDQ